MTVGEGVGYLAIVGKIVDVLQYLGLRFKKRLYIGQKFKIKDITYYVTSITRNGNNIHVELSEDKENKLEVKENI